jgi:hypothetical protein
LDERKRRLGRWPAPGANKEPEKRDRTYYDDADGVVGEAGAVTTTEQTLAGGRLPILIPLHEKRL